MFGKRKDKIYLQITVDDSVDVRAVRDYLISVVFRKMSFIRHASASFGVLSNNVVAEDYETSRAYEGIAEKVVDEAIEKNNLVDLQSQLNELQEKIEERIALD